MADWRTTGTGDEREEAVSSASRALGRGELAVFPTDTVYGIAADAFRHDAVAALLAAKGRGRQMPPPVLVSRVVTADALAERIPDYARKLMAKFWPGALTLILRAQPSLMWDLGETKGTVALRMPDEALCLEIIERTGPLAVSSANLTGRDAATTAGQAAEMLGEKVAVIVDGGPTPGSVPSTIVDCTGDRPVVVREGLIAEADVMSVVGPGDEAADPTDGTEPSADEPSGQE